MMITDDILLAPPPRIELVADAGSSKGPKTGKNTLFTDKNTRFVDVNNISVRKNSILDGNTCMDLDSRVLTTGTFNPEAPETRWDTI
jgi:hypothetical protein